MKEEGQTQEQIAAQLDAEQGTVSKWIPSNIPRNNAASDSRRKLTGNMQTHNAGQTDNRRDDCDLLMPRLAKVAMEPL